MEKRLPLPTGTVLQGRYRIMRQLGHGGFGAVYEAVDDEIGKSFALKETFYAAHEELRQAFKREARILASLEHDAFPNVSHYFTEGDGCFLVMELVRGDDLDKLLSQRATPFEQADVLTWAEQILDALHDLHSGGIIHRDLKPSNLKLTPKGKIKVLDFGIAKGALEGETEVMTTVGSLAAATLQYAPLEQLLKASPQHQMMLSVISADKVIETLKHGTTAASDLYALAATLYQLLTKTLPVDAATRAIAIWTGKNDPLVPAHQVNPQISKKVSEVLAKAMRLDRHERYQSADEMLRMFRGVDSPTSAQTQSMPADQLPTVIDVVAQTTQPIPRPPISKPVETVPVTIEVPPLRKQPVTAEKKGLNWIYAGAGVLCLLLIVGLIISISSSKNSAGGNVAVTNKNTKPKPDKPVAFSNYEIAQTLNGHSNDVESVAYSLDGKTLASGSTDGTVKLWDAASGDLKQTLTGHNDLVYAVAFSPDSKTLASGSRDHTIKFWDVTSGTLLRTLTGHDDTVRSVAFSPDGSTLASGSSDGSMRIWDTASGTLKQTITQFSGVVTSVAFSRGGETIAGGCNDGTIKLWYAASGTLNQTLTGHSNGVNSVSFSPDGKTIASGSSDYSIKLWDAASGTLKDTLTGHSGAVESVAFSPDSKMLASGSNDLTIKLWDVASGTLMQTITPNSSIVNSVAFSPDGKTLASGNLDQTIKLWRVKK